MINLFVTNKQFRYISLMLVGFLLNFSLIAKTMEKEPPIILPVSLSHAGEVVNVKIKISDHSVYYFGLRFSYREGDQADRYRVKKLVGSADLDRNGNPVDPGIPTPVRINIVKIEDNQEIEILKKEVSPILTSWGGGHFKRQIAFTELTPGIYIINLSLLQSAPSFDGAPVFFSIGYDKFKTSFPSKKH